jgi:hypothetical protein
MKLDIERAAYLTELAAVKMQILLDLKRLAYVFDPDRTFSIAYSFSDARILPYWSR